MSETWSTWVEESCRVVEAAGQWRRPRTFDALGPVGRLVDRAAPDPAAGPVPGAAEDSVPGAAEGAGPGTGVVSFASNDYLGLSSHPAVVAAAHYALDRWGAGSGASRLITGSRPVHAELESALAEWKQCQQAVVFPTGFAANLSVLSVFGTEGAHLFSDQLNHASIIDGCRAARAPVTVYPHGDLERLDALVGASAGRPVIVSDTVFSMDGDAADLVGLVDVARRRGALLVLDEAHAVLGPELPAGWAGSDGADAGIDGAGPGVDVLRVGTLSKTLGSLGGFVAGPARFVELLVNRARTYIFTTALSPADAAAALAAVGVVRSAEGDVLRSRLAASIARVAGGVGQPGRRSPIIPVIMGEEERAMAASALLLEQGLWVPAIRPPTVPPGTSRLRVTVSAAHTDAQVDQLIGALAALDRGGPAAMTDTAGNVGAGHLTGDAVAS